MEQIDNLPAHYYALAELPKLNPMERDEAAEAFIKNTGAIINHGGNRAYYTEAHDRIQMPPYETFETPPAYLGTVFHELGHWSKHPSRLNRDFGRKRWGDEGYAMDELVSELNAAYLCADLGIEPTPAPDHAAYIQSWLKVLQGDKRAIFQAAGHAQRAADFLHSLQPAIKSPSPALSEAPATPLELPELPSPPEPAAPPLALVVDRPEKPRGFVEKERKRRAAKKVTGQTELF